ncbi:MAG: Rid family hydrolase [Limisphaerales bacterium]
MNRQTDTRPKTTTTKRMSTKVVIRPPEAAPAVGPCHRFPARSTVQVATLPRGANVEIEVIAHC